MSYKIHIGKESFSVQELIEIQEFASFSEFAKHAITFLKEWKASDSSLTAQTSGSTGNPKQIKLSKKDMINSAIATGEFFGFKPKTIVRIHRYF